MANLTIAPETTYTDIERDLIENEPPGLFPDNQVSIYGQVRKSIGDYLQFNFADVLAAWYNNLNPATVTDDDLREWEEMLNIPDSTGKTSAARRSFIQSRRERGPFTWDRRNRLIEAFITATFGVSTTFTPAGVSIDAGGIPLLADTIPLTSSYRVYEDVRNFSYEVRIDSAITPDIAGLTRELRRITPAGVSFTINNSLSGVAMLDYRKEVLNDQPELYFGFDNNVLDLSGNTGRNGNITGSVVGANGLTAILPGANKAMVFDGATGYVAAPGVDLGSEWAVEFWIRATVPTAPNTAWIWYQPGSGYVYLNEWGTLVVGGNSNYFFPSWTFLSATTYHMVVQARNGVGQVFVNGVERTPYNMVSPYTIAHSTVPFYIGGSTGPGNYMNGTLDEFAIYNHWLSPDRVTRHYQTGMNLL